MIGEENGVVTFEDIRNNAEIRTYIEKGNENLGVLGFTKHSVGHATKVSDTAAKILEGLDYDARTVELARNACAGNDETFQDNKSEAKRS